MAFTKLSAIGQPILPPATITLQAGETFVLPAGEGVISSYKVNKVPQTGWNMSGQYVVSVGANTAFQMYDSNLQVWRNINQGGTDNITVSSDGTNFRLANTTGCVVGAMITTGGAGMVNGFDTITLTPSAGGATFHTIVGGAINTSVTITNAGSGYVVPPILVFTPPANQGNTPYVLPTGYATLTGGAITGVTITNVGAGLVGAPTISVIPQSIDTTGAGAVLTASINSSSSGALTWVGVNTNGSPLTSVPTISVSGTYTTVPVVSALMNFVITGLTVTTAGAAYTNGVTFSFDVPPVITSSTPVWANPVFDTGITTGRPASLQVTTTTTTFTGSTVKISDSGYGFQAVPPAIYPSYVGATTQAALTPTVGGVGSTSLLYSI